MEIGEAHQIRNGGGFKKGDRKDKETSKQRCLKKSKTIED
jgi:hypothetical protein